MFIPTFYFKARIEKKQLLPFVGAVSPSMYCFLIPKVANQIIYGYLVSNDVLEYFLNEYLVKDFEIITIKEFEGIASNMEYHLWGNGEFR